MPEARVTMHTRGEAPALLRDAAVEAVAALQLLIAARVHDTALLYLEMFRQYRDEFEQLFNEYSTLPEPAPLSEPTDTPITLKRQWNGLALKQARLDQEPMTSLRELLEALRAVDLEVYRHALSDAASAGYQRELWMLALAGVEGAEGLLDQEPDDWDGVILSDGFAQVDWETRHLIWGRNVFEKIRRWAVTAMMAGWTWDVFAEGLDRTTEQHTSHVVGLFGNEMYRSYMLGGLIALGAARRDLGVEVRELWLTRDDPLVCPICRAKHMTVTSDRPVDDTHPGCRCIKVPVPSNFTPVAPLSFESFMQGAR